MTCRKIGPCCKGDKDGCQEVSCLYFGRLREEVGAVSKLVAATKQKAGRGKDVSHS